MGGSNGPVRDPNWGPGRFMVERQSIEIEPGRPAPMRSIEPSEKVKEGLARTLTKIAGLKSGSVPVEMTVEVRSEEELA